MNLTVNRVYIGSFEVENKVYPTAIYAVKKDLSKLKKIVVSDSEILTDQNKINSVFCDETYIKYLILAFYEENAPSNDPSLIIQIEKFVGDDTKDKWLKYLGILGTKIEKEENISDIVVDAKWIGQFSTEVNGRACHWCSNPGFCCNGGILCSTCPNDPTKKCCKTNCTIEKKTDCDSCKLKTICDTKLCKSNNCCYQATLAMIEKFNITTNRGQAIDIVTLINNSKWRKQSDLQANKERFNEAIIYIDESLKAGKPLVIGVHYVNNNNKTYNNNKATLHFMVIVGKVYKDNKVYYRFYDPGKISESFGKSKSNLLEIDLSRKMIYATYNNKTYTITEIRKNI
ncbi:MAG: hypothetical protein M0R02_08320 [Bacteroidales bacterium]|nr:hypothetical protein [Bacteroidales bacterium]